MMIAIAGPFNSQRRLIAVLLCLVLLTACQGQVAFHYSSIPTEGEEVLVHVIPPVYADDLKLRKIEGWVMVEFSINEKGRVDQARILEEYPRGVFSQAALDSAYSRKYKPRMIDGKPVRVTGKLTKSTFIMEKGIPIEKITCKDVPNNYGNEKCEQIQ
jgi:TonB family protein